MDRDLERYTKMKNKKGFTLAELLIVVAIIAVLVAISVPIFSSQLERSREAVDAANIRAQYAEVMAEALTENKDVNTDAGRKIPLAQKKDDWQNENFKDSLEGLGEIVGTPKANGNAWVSFEYGAGKVTIHFDESGSEPAGESDNIITAGTESPLSGYSKIEDGNYTISLDSPISGTIKINIIVHSGNEGHGSVKQTIELQVQQGHNDLGFMINTKNHNNSLSISFAEDIYESESKEIIESIKITKNGH